MNKEEMKELYDEFRDAEKEFYDLQKTVIDLCNKEQEQDREIMEINHRIHLFIGEKHQSFKEIHSARLEIMHLKNKMDDLKFNIKMSLITFLGVPFLTVSMFLIVFKLF